VSAGAGTRAAVGSGGEMQLQPYGEDDVYDYTNVHWTLVLNCLVRDGHAESSKERPARRRKTAGTLRGPWRALLDA